MPRVKPKLQTKDLGLDVFDHAEADRLRRHDAVVEDIDAGRDVDQAYRRHDFRTSSSAGVRGGLTYSVTENTYYGETSPHSFFRDLWLSATENVDGFDPLPHPTAGGPAEARTRLQREGATRQRETRTLSVTAGAGGDFALNFTPTAVPGYIASAFAAAVRSKAVVANVLHHEPLPAPGVKIETPRITTGTTAAVQTADNASASNTDLVEALVTSNMATVAGQQDISQQLLDHAQPAITDVVLATDLGNALGVALDQQILYGSAASGQLRGLTQVAGITTVTKTNASPTGLTNLLALGDLTAQTAAAYGQTPTHLLAHPRRLAYIKTKVAGVFEWPIDNIVSTPTLHSTDGASTNQDEAFAIVANEIWLFGGEPTFRVVLDHSGVNTLTCRFLATMYAGLLAHRVPAAIGRVSGSEFTAPVFT
jgi:Phage capsid family